MEYLNKEDYLPWIEKYRPKKLNKIFGQDSIIGCLNKMISAGSLPHMLFHGTSGTGKTSTILAIAKKLYGKNKTLMVMKLDASDDRGINSVREEIKGFAKKKTMYNKGIKLIILDEADSMTFDAQFALRQIIEKHSDTTRFCLICNYENKIIPAIKSRCTNFRFNPINYKDIEVKLKKISISEKLDITNKALTAIAQISNGDLRKSINLLQSISMRGDKIDVNLCYETAGIPPLKTIKKIYNYLINDKKDFDKTLNMFNKDIKSKGYSLSILLKELIKYMINNSDTIDDKILCNYMSKMSDLEIRVANSTFGDIYLSSLIGIFKSN